VTPENPVETSLHRFAFRLFAPRTEVRGIPHGVGRTLEEARPDASFRLACRSLVFAAPLMPLRVAALGFRGCLETGLAGCQSDLNDASSLLILPSPSGNPQSAGMPRSIRLS
jgi:hypothetical protein